MFATWERHRSAPGLEEGRPDGARRPPSAGLRRVHQRAQRFMRAQSPRPHLAGDRTPYPKPTLC